jgi:carboxypeptidase C (cathepsin A)
MRGSGAYIPVSNSSMLLLNNNAFTKFANVIWLEQPYFTGFSTSKDEGDRTSGEVVSLVGEAPARGGG